MIYLNPCLFFSLLVFVFFLNTSCTLFSDTNCLLPWNLSEYLKVWYFLLCATYTHRVNSRIYLFKADTELLFPCSDPTELQAAALTGEILPFFIPFHKFPSQGDQWCSTSMLLFWAITPKILLIRIWKSEKNKKYPLITRDKMSPST